MCVCVLALVQVRVELLQVAERLTVEPSTAYHTYTNTHTAAAAQVRLAARRCCCDCIL